MRKRVLCFILLFVIAGMFSGIVFADEETDKVDKAYKCLKDRVNESASLSLEEAVFVTLALGANDKALQKINSSKSLSEECWPNGNCNIKDTAQVVLAYDRIGKDTEEIINWLLTKNGTASGLTWYLQIITENNEPDTCDVSYDGATYTFTIDEEMKLSGSGGSCLSIDNSGYKLKISNDCLNKEFITSCDKSFYTNLLYEKGAGSVIYISETHSGSAKGTTTERIKAQCFKTEGNCDYEATLWAAAAIYTVTGETGDFIPYLKSLASSYREYFPSAFLIYMMGGNDRDEHYKFIIENKKRGGYWQFGNNKYFDTALAMLALSDADIENQGTINYLLNGGGKQTERGCWNNDNIRDTAFILYASPWVMAVNDEGTVNNGGAEEGESADEGGDAFDVPPSENCGNGIIDTNDNEVCECGDDGICGTSDDELNNETCASLNYDSGELYCNSGCTSFNTSMCVVNEGSNYNPNTITDCELANYYCVSGIFECRDAGGNILPDDTYACETWDKVCCTVNVGLETCSDLGGRICGYNEECSGDIVEAAEGSCCKGACIPYEETNECENNGGICRTVCRDDEEEKNYECIDSEKICCKEVASATESEEEESGIGWIWIVILIILIILVILGIIFRDKLRVWWFKFRGKAKTSKFSPRGPPGGRIMPRPIPTFGARQPIRRIPVSRGVPPEPRPRPKTGASAKDKELEETMKKLKEMSK